MYKMAHGTHGVPPVEMAGRDFPMSDLNRLHTKIKGIYIFLGNDLHLYQLLV